ncbi:taste receptor type 2 member 134 [Tupaia chinensis]|uniref:Taste receptor type 2 n=1 Tax=Tupaia chinensis TaxID=246437 RepID=L9JAE3_TUPCH|nr:taste receptor type 2 member 134 [Tupaia chinensis]ELW47545.1 Taste receptor type 2 member 134 [Tupaia chinensis]
MPSSLMLVFMVIFFLESLAAMLQNGFMAAVLCREWARGRALPTGDMIVACLAASRLCVHGTAIVNNLLASFVLCCNFHYFNVLWDFTNTLMFWLTAWLAVFYCVKISSFSHPVFVWLKWRISRMVPKLLQGSLALSVLSLISSITTNTMFAEITASQDSQGNNTLAVTLRTFHQHYFLSHMVVVVSIPFLLFLVSTLLLMFSLRRHLGQMRNRKPGPCDPSTQAHTTALKSLTFFLISYTSYFLFLIISTLRLAIYNHWHWVWEAVTYTGLSLHSTILVLSSPKLRKALKGRL